MTDGNTNTHPGDFFSPNNNFTIDFGTNYGVKMSAVKMQARTNGTTTFPARIAGGRVLASMDGVVWTEITSSKAVSTTDMQTLSIATGYQNVPYRYLKVVADASPFNIGELRIVGERMQLANLINAVTIQSSNPDHTKAVAGDNVTLNFTSTQPISNVKLNVSGKSYDTQSTDNINWSASYIVSPYEFPQAVSFSINYTDAAGNYGKPVTATTNGSSVAIQETSDYIDVLSKASAFGIPAKDASSNIYVDYGTTNANNGKAFDTKIIDKSTSTYSDWTGPNSNGYGTYLVIDMGAGSAIALDRAYVLARTSWGSRLSGAYLQGSNDGATWSTISSKAVNSADWQTVSMTDKTSFVT